MEPWAWAALGAVFTALGVGAALIVHIIRYAYKNGQTDQRLANVESAIAAASDLKMLVAALTSTVEGLKGAVNRLDGYFERVNQPPPPPRPRRAKRTPE